MKMSDGEGTGSGWSRAEDSDVRTQVAGYGARPRGARAGQSRNGIILNRRQKIS